MHAWNTTFRMHEDKLWPCIFGCGCGSGFTGAALSLDESRLDPSESDTTLHYMSCPVLWQLAREQIPGEESVQIVGRLGFTNPTAHSLQRLAICHYVYHACKNDPQCLSSNSMPAHPHVVQCRASGVAKFAASIIT